MVYNGKNKEKWVTPPNSTISSFSGLDIFFAPRFFIVSSIFAFTYLMVFVFFLFSFSSFAMFHSSSFLVFLCRSGSWPFLLSRTVGRPFACWVKGGQHPTKGGPTRTQKKKGHKKISITIRMHKQNSHCQNKLYIRGRRKENNGWPFGSGVGPSILG